MGRLPLAGLSWRTPRVRLSMLAGAFTLLLAAWIMSSAPFTAPDENFHYMRALGISQGVLLGKKTTYDAVPFSRRQQNFLSHDTRLVTVPRDVRPTGLLCSDGKDDPVCSEPVPDGNFPPIPYLLPALAFKLSHHTATLQWTTRVASALPSLAFLLLALLLMWDGTGVSIVGLLSAITPMVLFCASIMNSSGPGITSAIALGAAAFRVARAGPRAPRWTFVALAVSGFVAIPAGPIGPLFVVAFLVPALCLLGWGRLTAIWTERRADAIVALAGLVLGIVTWEVWRQVSGTAPGLFGISPLGKNLNAGLDQMPQVMESAIGFYGTLTIPMRIDVYRCAWVFEGLLVAAALAAGRYRDRILLTITGLLAGAFPILFYAFVDRLTGFALQGREILPVLLLIPMLAGELLYRSERSWVRGIAARWIVTIAITAIAVLQGFAWWWNARYSSGAYGVKHFWVHATYQPPAGWWPWVIAAVAGTILFLLFGLSEAPVRSIRWRGRSSVPQPA